MLQTLWPLIEHYLLSSLSTPYGKEFAQNAQCQKKSWFPSILMYPPHSLNPVVYRTNVFQGVNSVVFTFFPFRRQRILIYPCPKGEQHGFSGTSEELSMCEDGALAAICWPADGMALCIEVQQLSTTPQLLPFIYLEPAYAGSLHRERETDRQTKTERETPYGGLFKYVKGVRLEGSISHRMQISLIKTKIKVLCLKKLRILNFSRSKCHYFLICGIVRGFNPYVS